MILRLSQGERLHFAKDVQNVIGSILTKVKGCGVIERADEADRVFTVDDVDGSLDLRRTERPPFRWWAYVIAFLVVDVIAVGLMHWSVCQVEPLQYFGGFISKMWTSQDFQFLLNMLIWGVVYLVVLMLVNRFWVATPVFLFIVGLLAVIERFKVLIRYETIKPSDLGFLKSDAGNMLEFIPGGTERIFAEAAMFVLGTVVVCYALAKRDGRRRLIETSPATLGATVRMVFVVVPALFLGLFTASLSTSGSWANDFATAMGDSPKLWDSVQDAQANGTIMGFLRFVNPKVMDEPENYSKETMLKLVEKYQDAADEINETRRNNMDDSTVIMVLSESFSDPTRVPGVELNEDPMPNIRSIKENTTSGLMLSAGYGGGTANMEFMAMTGLSMANFDPSLSSPYQQLIPKLSWAPSFNQLWNGGKDSQAFHPYQASMYSRAENYKKFKFSHFWTLQQPDVIAHKDRIDRSPYVRDSAAYQSVLEKIDTGKSQFLSILTMQNHMGYDDWYDDNQFQASGVDGVTLGLDETQQIQTYAKGVRYTDEATKAFLDQLDNIDKPITVIFYGDHLPGVYSTASKDDNNSLVLHETDYFIWSNKASDSAGTKLPDSTSAYTSPNYFMAQVAEHMNAKVSPYLAFLTELHEKVPAMEPPVVNKIQGWSRIPEGQALYLDSNGERIDITQADKETKELLADYKLIQYDITAGEGYLEDTGFMDLPAHAEESAELPTGTKNAADVPEPEDALPASRKGE